MKKWNSILSKPSSSWEYLDMYKNPTSK